MNVPHKSLNPLPVRHPLFPSAAPVCLSMNRYHLRNGAKSAFGSFFMFLLHVSVFDQIVIFNIFLRSTISIPPAAAPARGTVRHFQQFMAQCRLHSLSLCFARQPRPLTSAVGGSCFGDSFLGLLTHRNCLKESGVEGDKRRTFFLLACRDSRTGEHDDQVRAGYANVVSILSTAACVRSSTHHHFTYLCSRQFVRLHGCTK